MMKVAIPQWQGRVSPVFDVAGQMLVVEIDGGREWSRQERHLDAEFPQARAAWLVREGIDVLICGAISRCQESAVVQAGVELIPQICGDVECILDAFIEGQLEQDSFRMPGCRGKGRRRRHQGGLCRKNLRNNEGLA